MRRTSPLILAGFLLLQAAPASAAVPHTVVEGETLWSIAAASNLTTRTLAAYNGLSENSQVVLGSTIQVPSVEEGAAALGGSAPAPEQATATAANPAEAPAATPAPAAGSGHVTSGDVHSVAAQHGVDGSLVAAIGYQESGFNNAMVSSTNAQGVMQVMPGTWDEIQANLTSRQLDPSSATDNVHAGTLYLRQLLNETGGDAELAAAAYYQGLASVREIGMLPETRRYVDNVMALRGRFGG